MFDLLRHPHSFCCCDCPPLANTIWTRSSAEHNLLTGQEFSNLPSKDCKTEGGVNCSPRSGKNNKPPRTKSRTTSDRSPPISKSSSSEQAKASSSGMISKNTSRKRSLEGACDADFEALEREYKSAFEKAEEWELSMYEHYSRGDCLNISSMMAYHKNVERGFARCNDENLYASIRREDADGRLFNEAMRGFELAKPCMKLGPIIWKRNAMLKYRGRVGGSN
jgi:hypothetical protein